MPKLNDAVSATKIWEKRNEISRHLSRWHNIEFQVLAAESGVGTALDLPDAAHFGQLFKEFMRGYYRDRIQAMQTEIEILGFDLDEFQK